MLPFCAGRPVDALADHPDCCVYVARATARPAFVKAHDRMAHFAAAD